jgi:hypothetical protein
MMTRQHLNGIVLCLMIAFNYIFYRSREFGLMLTMLGMESTTSCRLCSKAPGPMKTTPQVIFDYYSHRDICDTTVCPTHSNKLATRPNVSPNQCHPSIRTTLPSTHRLFTSASNSPCPSRPPVPSSPPSPPSPPSSLSVGTPSEHGGPPPPPTADAGYP